MGGGFALVSPKKVWGQISELSGGLANGFQCTKYLRFVRTLEQKRKLDRKACRGHAVAQLALDDLGAYAKVNGHAQWQTGSCVWCSRCGKYTRRSVRGLASRCRGRIPETAHGTHSRKANLAAGRAPRARAFAAPIGQPARLTLQRWLDLKDILVGPREEVPDGQLGSEVAGPSASRQKPAEPASQVRGEGITARSGLALSHAQRPVTVKAALHSRTIEPEAEAETVGVLLELQKIGLPVVFPSASHHKSSAASSSKAVRRQHGITETGRPRELGMEPARMEQKSEMVGAMDDLLALHNDSLPVVWPDGTRLPGRPRLRR